MPKRKAVDLEGIPAAENDDLESWTSESPPPEAETQSVAVEEVHAATSPKKQSRPKSTKKRTTASNSGSSSAASDEILRTPASTERISPAPVSKKRKSAQKARKDKTEYATLLPQGFAPVETPIDNHWMYVFFRFCAERHKMQEKRDAGVPRDELSTDETMQKSFVGNVFRELDAGSKKMKEIIMASGDQSNEEICFRVFLYCAFYNMPTWDELVEKLGEIPTWKKFDLERYGAILHERSFVRRETIYTSGFQLVPPTQYFKTGDNKMPHYAASLRLVKAIMEMGLPERLRTCGIFAIDASETLRTVPTLGGFLSLNLLCNFNDSKHMKFFYRNFATCGPGSRKFLQRMFGKTTINSVAMEEAGLVWLYQNQWRYWARLGENPPHARDIPGIRPGMRVLDFENALCWAHRYVNSYQKEQWGSVADIPHPDFDASADEASMPAWCDQEAYTNTSSRAAFLHDYEEAKLKLDKVVEDEEVYEVEKIVCRKGSRNDTDGLFRVRWKGWPPESDTWERASTLSEGSSEALEEWLDWEAKCWGSIERIKNDFPYKTPEGFSDVKTEPAENLGKNSSRVKRESKPKIKEERKPRIKLERKVKVEVKAEDVPEAANDE